MNKPLKPCNKVGCNKLNNNSNGYCDEHKQNRQTATQRGYTYKWTKYRKSFLCNNPLCQECLKQNRYTLANVVDHIIPHKGDMVLFWDTNNHQALCKKCHDTKTAREDGGFGNKTKY